MLINGHLLISHKVVEEPQSSHHISATAGGIALAIFQTQQVIFDHLLGEHMGRLLIVTGKSYDGGQVIALGFFARFLNSIAWIIFCLNGVMTNTSFGWG